MSAHKTPYRLHVGTEPAYNVQIGPSLREAAVAAASCLPAAGQVRLVSDEQVYALYGEPVKNCLETSGHTVALDLVAPGEGSKSIATWESLMNRWAADRLHRTDGVLALGGGVTGDLAGFAAASYMRGIPLVQMPTTLLAAVDASVGGKTALNLPLGKNLLGAFKQPIGVFCATDLFQSLADVDWQNGTAELIKMAILTDPDLFARLESRPFTSQSDDLTGVIATAVGHKITYVEADASEKGIRAHLNLGHTLGHAIEQVSGHTVPHGHAVAMGLAFISRAAVALGRLTPTDGQRILRLLQTHHLPISVPFDRNQLAKALLNDKKADGDGIRWILPVGIGHCLIHSVAYADLSEFLTKGGL